MIFSRPAAAALLAMSLLLVPATVPAMAKPVPKKVAVKPAQTTTSLIPAETAPAVTPAPDLSGTVTQTAAPPVAPAVATPSTTTTTTTSTTTTTVAPAVVTAKDVMQILAQPADVRGNYQGIRYTLSNKQGHHLQILHGEVLNGVDEAAVAQQEVETTQRRRRLTGGLLRGLSSVPFMGGVASYGSMGAYRAAAIGSSLASTAASTVENSAGTAAANIQGKYVRQFDSVMLSPQESWNFMTLVPRGARPQLKLVFKNLETNQIFDLME